LKPQSEMFIAFYADWCGFCKQLAPVYEQVAANYAGKLTFAKANIDTIFQTIKKSYNVTSVPTIF
jgi:thioredoxin 1